MNQELELVESMDKLSRLMRKFQTQLRTGDLKEYTLRQLYYIELIDKNEESVFLNYPNSGCQKINSVRGHKPIN